MPSLRQILNGYLDAFDPDFVTYVGCDSETPLGDASRLTIDVDDIVRDLKSIGSSYYGVGYYELARYVGHEEMRFERKKPIHLVTPSIDGEYSTFFASLAGRLPIEIAEDVDRQLKEAYEAPQIALSMGAYDECLNRTYLTPLRLAQHGLEADEFATAWRRNCVLYLDAGNLLDVIDFWNLRALGFKILPVPKQAGSQPKVIEIIGQFIKENHAVSRHDPASAFNARILRARSISDCEFNEFVASCTAIVNLQNSPALPIIQNWFPAFWDQWSREHSDCDCVRFFGGSSENEVVADEDRIRFNPLIPRFADRDSTGLSVANEVSFTTYSDDEPIAQVFPQAHEDLGKPFGILSFTHDWRFSAVGPVHFPRFRSSASFGVPKSQPLVEQWFACDGWQVSTSQAGLATRELLKHLGGAYLTSRIADEDTVALLSDLGTGSPITYKRLRGKAWQIAKKKHVDSPDGIVGTLMTSRMVALGVQLKCATCGRHPWYEMSAIRPVVECTECLRPLELPVYAPDRIEWAYRGIGPLVSLSTSTGAFPVLLTLRFLSVQMHVPITPAFGVTISKNGEENELDLSAFVLESRFRRSRVRKLFAECKAYNKIERDDVKRLEKLGTMYPGSILIFATLRGQLDDKEVALLSALANKGRRRLGAEEPLNPVMVLSGAELFSPYGITTHWKRLGGRHASLAPQLLRDDDLLAMCSITQQLHLNMAPMTLPT